MQFLLMVCGMSDRVEALAFKVWESIFSFIQTFQLPLQWRQLCYFAWNFEHKSCSLWRRALPKLKEVTTISELTMWKVEDWLRLLPRMKQLTSSEEGHDWWIKHWRECRVSPWSWCRHLSCTAVFNRPLTKSNRLVELSTFTIVMKDLWMLLGHKLVILHC